ncbi:hypothetical protein [Lactobacillus delbrueckii]|uniref:hypothetical protein n=1 Tax=Lactobacillus delbrueckii TaxID=1584 RepID=UPI001F5AED0F|nr:hypothetical protein [Lactobacillus delbrueckii]
MIALFQGTTNKFAVQKKAYDLFWIISGFCLVMSFLGIVVSGIFNANNTYLILLVFLIVMQIVAELFSSAALAVYIANFPGFYNSSHTADRFSASRMAFH